MRRHLMQTLLTAVLAACASVPAARMALPEALGATEPERVTGLNGLPDGTFTLGAEKGRFARRASRLALFDTAWTKDRVAASFRLGAAAADCQGRQSTVQAGPLGGRLQPFDVRCEFRGPGEATLQWGALDRTVGRAERSGEFRRGDVRLDVRSVHRVEGSPLPLDAPIGALILHRGVPVGAVEWNGLQPRVWRPAAGAPMHVEVTWIALALALLWDPAAAA